MARSIAPFKINDDEPKTPLSVSPYNSRFFQQELNAFDVAKNYQYTAFRPGYPLQSSELDEIQERHHYNHSAFGYMVNGWSAFAGDPFSGSGDEDTNLRYAGPAWDGATPIMPYNQGTYIELSSGDDPVITLDAFPSALAQIPDLVQITDNGTTLTITLNEGLYYSSVKTGSQVDNNFKYFIYYNVLTAGTNTITLNKLEAGKTYVGFSMGQSYIVPSTYSQEDQFSDASLNDNSSGFTNDVAAGAARVKIFFQRVVTSGDLAGGGVPVPDNTISKVLYVDHTNNKIRYMNGVPVVVSDSLGATQFGTFSE
tara:strand:- start:1733 stop:2665 length:933 start_codon:yes stop_codon:yes gene_type:complete